MLKINIKNYNFKKIFVISILIMVLALSALITFRCFSFLPSLKQVFNACGISDVDGRVDKYDMSIHFLDVGKADAILIKCKDKTIVIDSGNVEPTNPVVEYLKRQGVKTIDLLVASHQDKDHIGGMANIIYEFEVLKFMMPELPETLIPESFSYETMLHALSAKNLEIERPVLGKGFSVGDMDINILGPIRQYNDSINNNSIVMKLIYKNDSFLFMGDVEQDVEYDLIRNNLDLKSNVIKIGHHGSRTSTTQELLDAVLPNIAIISVGEDNNDLPKSDVIDRINKNNIDIYRTDLNGVIAAGSNGDGINMFTQK